MNTINLLVFCGGKSAEHEISLVSAWNLLNTIDENKFVTQLITIDKSGMWFAHSVNDFLNQEPNPQTITIKDTSQPVAVQLGKPQEAFLNLATNEFLPAPDVIFPLLHGPNGEDGSMQGILKHLQIPFIGSGVLGSALCMDKAIAKQIMVQNTIPTSNFLTLSKHDFIDFESVKNELDLPLFVKPANLGSSVGISKVDTAKDFDSAIELAFSYDEKVIVEEFVKGVEVECAVLGYHDAIVSEPGTYIHSDDFFEFETKYLKNDQISMQIPAEFLTDEQREELKELSLRAYHALQCKGFARVDTFVTEDGRLLVNEINTIPGFTQNSMYPVLLEKKGISYNELVKTMCEQAIHEFEKSVRK